MAVEATDSPVKWYNQNSYDVCVHVRISVFVCAYLAKVEAFEATDAGLVSN
jgi:hypothetical protein